MWVGGQGHAPTALPLGKIRYPLYSRLGGPQGRSGRVWKISPPPGFDPRIAQPVASRYTYWAIPAHNLQTNSNQKQKVSVECIYCRRYEFTVTAL